jgi:hypothetical protein
LARTKCAASASRASRRAVAASTRGPASRLSGVGSAPRAGVGPLSVEEGEEDLKSLFFLIKEGGPSGLSASGVPCALVAPGHASEIRMRWRVAEIAAPTGAGARESTWLAAGATPAPGAGVSWTSARGAGVCAIRSAPGAGVEAFGSAPGAGVARTPARGAGVSAIRSACGAAVSAIRSARGAGVALTLSRGAGVKSIRSATLVQGTEPHYPVSDGTYLYWTDRDTWSSDAVFKLPLAGGSVVTLAPLQQGGASFLTLGTHDFFWAAGDDEGTIVKLPLE